MDKILHYDLFIFDFDGTILDTETYHCKAWNEAFCEFKKEPIELTMKQYHKYFHSLNMEDAKTILRVLYNIDNYDEIYQLKQTKYMNIILNEDIGLIRGVNDFLKFIIDNDKKFVIVTNTSNKAIEIFKKKYPILNLCKIYTKECFLNKKPNPECYLKVSNDYPCCKKIGFEDSLIGLDALYKVNSITPVLIYDKNYFYMDKMINTYKNIITLENFNIDQLNQKLVQFKTDDNLTFINEILKNNIDQLINNFSNMSTIIEQITIIIKDLSINSHIYLSGMGKSGYICKKSASTWQSLSIKCSYIDLPNLPHGDFGIFNDNDILILISNSGNTDENIYILNYINKILKKKINTISIVANENSLMEKLSNFTFILKNIKEADNINMTPSTSSLLFMALLDGIGINLKKNITKEEFKLAHPGGSLGKK